MYDDGVRHDRDDVSRGGVKRVAGQAAKAAPLTSSAGPPSFAEQERFLLFGSPRLSDSAVAVAAAAAAAGAVAGGRG